jgi:hypothetical protein
MTIRLSSGVAGRYRLIRMISLMLYAIACASCSMNLRPQPETGGQSIAGKWQLQSPSREVLAGYLRAVMEQARAKEEQRERRRYPYSIPPEEAGSNPENTAPASSGGMSPSEGGIRPMSRRNNWEVREQREQQEALLNAVLPSNSLQITQVSSRVEILPDVGGRRRFEIGVNSTLVSSYADFQIESGWQANIFVVHSRDRERGINIVERYQRISSNALHMQVELSLPNAKDQTFAADYVLAQP